MKYTAISSGKEVEIVKINYYKIYAISTSVDEELREEGWQVDKPTYEVPVGTGETKQTHEHVHEVDENDEVINSTLETEEDHQLWEEYLKTRREAARRYGRRVASFALINGVKIDMDADEGWEEQQKYFGIKIPEDRNDKYMHYLRSEVFPDIQEREQVAAEIIAMSSPDRDSGIQEAVQEFFRGALEEEQGS